MKILPYVTAFVSGFIIMSLEILGFRVLAPHFGYSIYVFGTLIGLILLALAIGYWIGGMLSRRKIGPKNFFFILLLAGLYIAVASAFYERVVQFLVSYGIIAGAFLATFILWAAPMIILAAVSPYLVGMMSEKEHPGDSSGRISAAGTLGGLAGTFLTSFFLLPILGTHATFVGNAYAAIAMALFWLFIYSKKWLLVVVIVPFLAHALPPMDLPTNVVHAEESPYSHLEVVDYGDMLILRADRRSGTAYSAIMKDGSLSPSLLYNLFSVPVAAKDSRRGLLLGAGTGTLLQIHEDLNPNLRLVAVEIDPQIIEIGKRFFKLENLKNIDAIVIADARPFLAQESERYDMIEMDIFRGGIEIPFYLVSKEFFGLTRERLKEDGIFMMNVYDPTKDKNIEKRILNTIASVYPRVYVAPAGSQSFFIVGSNMPLAVPDIGAGGNERLTKITDYFKERVKEAAFFENEEIFTDNLAPIESLYTELPSKIFYNTGM